mmetsp:Transcript_13089/g.24467  ORF Transcript_13089/g.24467 Transcript_13089/m.24467 type:complete len:106 (-) Transcript_13089:59-376(-)
MTGEFTLVAEHSFPVKEINNLEYEVYCHIIYAYNTCLKWQNLDNGSLIRFKDLTECSTFAQHCDGAKRRAGKLIKKAAEHHKDIEVEGECMRVTAEEEMTDEDWD